MRGIRSWTTSKPRTRPGFGGVTTEDRRRSLIKIPGSLLALVAAAFLLLLAVALRERPAEAKGPPGVVRARALEIVDSRGRTRAGIVLADETTEPGVHILASRDGTWVSLQRGEQRRVITPGP